MSEPSWLQSGLIFEGIVGSTAYGLATEGSDIDKRGICVASMCHYTGLQEFEQYEDPEQDRVIYDVRKFCRLALNGNPNILELLWLDDQYITTQNWAYKRLRERRSAFLSKRLIKAYMGYAQGQMQRLLNHKDQPVREGRNPKRAEIETKFGYDTKHASHVIRLLIQGAQLADKHTMQVKLEGTALKACMEIKLGKWSFEAFNDYAQALLERFRGIESTTTLPDTPNTEGIERILMRIIRNVEEDRYDRT